MNWKIILLFGAPIIFLDVAIAGVLIQAFQNYLLYGQTYDVVTIINGVSTTRETVSVVAQFFTAGFLVYIDILLTHAMLLMRKQQ